MILGSAQTSGPTDVTVGGGGVPGGPTSAPVSPNLIFNTSICQLERIAAVNITDIVRRLNIGELGPEATEAPTTQGVLRSRRGNQGPPLQCKDGPKQVSNRISFFIQLL